MPNNSFNPQLLDLRVPDSKREHRQIIIGSVVAAIFAAIVGLAYWWSAEKKAKDLIVDSSSVDYKLQVAEKMNQPSADRADQQSINKINQRMVKDSKVSASDADKAEILKRMSGN